MSGKQIRRTGTTAKQRSAFPRAHRRTRGESARHGIDRIPFGNKLMANESFIAGRLDRGIDGGIVNFLVLIRLTPAGISRRVVVGKIGMVLLDRADDIALHYLHVVNIIEQPDRGRIDLLDELHAPTRVIALVTGMIDFAPRDARKNLRALIEALFVITITSIAGETNERGDLPFCRECNSRLEFLFDPVSILPPIEAVDQGCMTHHCGDLQAVLNNERPEFLIRKIHPLISNPGGLRQQGAGLETTIREAPPGKGLP
jgi:hypothetical protein